MELALAQPPAGQARPLWVAASSGSKFIIMADGAGLLGDLRHQVAEAHFQLFPHQGRVVCVEIHTAEPEASCAGYRLPDGATLDTVFSASRVCVHAEIHQDMSGQVGHQLWATPQLLSAGL